MKATNIGLSSIIFRVGKADYADYLIGVLNRRAGCSTTLTLRQAYGRAALEQLNESTGRA